MTKKLLITLSILTLFTSCETRSNANTFDEGVVINGVRWATRNVDRPGTFTENPEDFGMLFQWNRRKGWNTTDEIVNPFDRAPVEVEGWDRTASEGTMWYAENDPCPVGWRVPTFDELYSLHYARRVRERKNGVAGRLIGIAPNQIFLPAAGIRGGGTGNRQGGMNYWSSTSADNEDAMMLVFGVGFDVGSQWRGHGYSVRCVAIDSELSYPIISQIEVSDVSASLDGMVINGIRWATRNVDAPGTFVETPESAGMYFQWNRRKGWSVTDEFWEEWNRMVQQDRNQDITIGTAWYAENDPCPPGWRVPTLDELMNLFELDNDVWARKNGVNGRLFGTAPYQIFLPAVGRITDRGVFGAGGLGGYWGSTLYNELPLNLWFNNDDGVYIEQYDIIQLRHWGSSAFSVRCVAIE